MKKFLMTLAGAALAICLLGITALADGNVAKVGDTEYATIDEAIAAWEKGTTLTLLDDVTLSDVVTFSFKETRTLDLGEYTLTAASDKNAITINHDGNFNEPKDPANRARFVVNADEHNPGGIVASSGKCAIEFVGSNKYSCGMELVINGGVFSGGSYSIRIKGSMQQSAPYFIINGGVFEKQIWTEKARTTITGGEFPVKSTFKGDEDGSYTVVSGGRFKVMPFFTNKVNAICFGTSAKAMTTYDCDVYMDDEGYYCVAPITEKPGDFEASIAASATNSYVKSYSNVKNDGAFFYTDAYYALEQNKSRAVKLYTNLDEAISVTDKNRIIDLTYEGSGCDVVLNKDDAKISILYAENTDCNAVVTSGLDAYAPSFTETTEDGVVTRVYTLALVTESTEKIVVNDNSDTVSASAKAYIDGTNGGTVEVEIPAEAIEDEGDIYLKVVAKVDVLDAFDENAVIYDINLVDEDGEKVEVEGTFTVKLPYNGDKDDIARYEVFYLNGESFEDMNAEYDPVENAFVFTVDHFSEYVIADTELMESGIAKTVYIEYKATANPNVYDIYAVAEEGKKINRFSSTQLKFEIINDKTDRTDVAYTLAPATNIKMSQPDEDGYVLFNFDGVNAEDSNVADKVHFATVTFEGYGKFQFVTVDTADKAMLHTATIIDNIVVDYVCDAASKYVLDIESSITAQLYVPVTDLTVNVAFPNSIEDKTFEYQDMTVTVSGGDLEQALTVKLGGDCDVSELDVYDGRKAPAVEADFVNGAYVVKINQLLTVNTSYVVTVEGAGYRTARYTVTMTEAKTLNFWNNVKDNAIAIEEGKNTMKTNFLAGDIVKDNNINIYDLSAVVSYFGETMSTEAYNAYAKYDLNRDGKIDSKDVAYVLVSWNN